MLRSGWGPKIPTLSILETATAARPALSSPGWPSPWCASHRDHAQPAPAASRICSWASDRPLTSLHLWQGLSRPSVFWTELWIRPQAWSSSGAPCPGDWHPVIQRPGPDMEQGAVALHERPSSPCRCEPGRTSSAQGCWLSSLYHPGTGVQAEMQEGHPTLCNLLNL